MAPMTKRRDGVRWGRVVVVLIAVLVINAPYVLHEVALHHAATAGVPVMATVTDVSDAGDDVVVAFRLPKSVDAQRSVRTVKVDRAVGARAASTHRLEVAVVKGQPSAFHVEGQVRSWTPLIVTLIADVLIALMVLLSWRLGGRIRRPPLVGVALADVESGAEGSLLDRQDDGTYVINGEISSAGPTSLVLVLRDRDVEIHLRDHQNPIPVGSRARVRAHLVG